MKRFFTAVLSVAMAWMVLACAGSAFADVCTVPGTSTIGFGQITIPPNANVGDTLATVTKSYTVNCPADSYYQFDPAHVGYHMVFISDMANSTIGGVWATDTAGIGIRVTNTTHNIVVSGNQCITYSTRDECKYAPSQYDSEAFTLSFDFKFELVKTGAISANQLSPTGYIIGLSSYSIRTGVNNPDKAYTDASAIMLGDTTTVAATCTVQQNPISVTLPDLNVSQLNPVGTTGGDTPFQIDLECSGGKDVYITLTDATSQGNRTDQLTLTNDSSASGVSLRILKSGTAIDFGPDSTASGNPGQWFAGSSANKLSIPLTVQYISTGTATPGTVKAAATFTLSYQ